MEQLQVLLEQIKESMMAAIDTAVSTELTQGTMMFLGGLAGAMLGMLAILIALAVFPGQRRRMLKKLGKE